MPSIAVASSRATPGVPDNRPVSLPLETLRCINQRFHYIARRLQYAFYAIAVISTIAGTMSSILHANHDLFPSMQSTHNHGLAFAALKEFASSLLLVVPVQAVAAECQRAFSIGIQYEMSGDPLPAEVIRHLAQTRTLFYEHPFARAECSRLKAYLHNQK